MINSFETGLELPSQEATEDLARVLALWARPGYLIALTGDLGAGKTVLARAFVRALLTPGTEQDIPSPSFSLVQTYDEARVPVFHADLYRLKSAGEAGELGLSDLLTSHCGVIEWAGKLEEPLGPDLLAIHLSGSGDRREARIVATGGWAQALGRNAALARFLGVAPFTIASRSFFEGDASARRYEKVKLQGETVLLMDMPQRPDGPVVKDGKPYSQIAHLAEGITAVVAINDQLHGLGYSVPRTIKADLEQGFALIEDLGDKVYGRMTLAGEDMREPLETAAAVLADMATRDWPHQVAADKSHSHRLSPYDAEALLIEADLLPSWYVPYARGVAVEAQTSQSFADVWQRLMAHMQPVKRVWTLRDYHSPNLIWIPEREGLRRVGIIDTQDAVLGHPAYDLVSMCQDARVDVSEEMQDHIVNHYCLLRRQRGSFDETSFRASYAVLGAQRATKILGIFARLSKRDSKHGYLKHMPRVAGYLRRNLNHPVLAELKAWYEEHLPEALGRNG